MQGLGVRERCARMLCIVQWECIVEQTLFEAHNAVIIEI